MLDPNKAREKLNEILNRREYTMYQQKKGLFETWWDQAKEWVKNVLAKLFPSMESAASASGPVLIVIIITIVLLFLFFTFLWIRRSRRNRKFREQKPLQSLKEMNWTFREHLNEAKIWEERKDYTRSTRHLFLALLLYFHEKEWLEARLWKTNWEYYDELRKVNQSSAKQFYFLAGFFDEVTYGEREVNRDEYTMFSTEVKNMMMSENQPLGERR